MTDIQTRLQQALGDAYSVERELARGGMSRLFLATETSLDRQVVIKLLPPEMASAVSAARFRQEIEVAAHLQHPHVLPVLGTGASGDLIWFVMPYVEGESLRHRLESTGRLPVDEAVRVLIEVADALAYAHQRGVVHRDIKPENILLQQGHAVITDFGIAHAREQAREGERLTELGTSIGTPGYMSPEQASGEQNLDARTDVYALAVVGYEMLGGEPPFTGPTPQAVLAAHLTKTPTPMADLRPEVPRGVSDALQRALAKDPSERFQTAGEFRDALRAVTTGPVQIVTFPKRWRVAAAVLALPIVLGGVLALWPGGFRVEGDPRQSLVIFPFENRTGDATQDYLQEASMNLLGLAVSHWQDLRVYDDERTASLMRRRDLASPADIDFDAAQAMAREARVGTLVLGDIRREGDSLAVEAKVHDTRTGERLATEIVRAPWGADPRPLFDAVAARILEVSGAPAGERPHLLAQTTSNLAAYRAYLRGTRALQRFQLDTAAYWLDSAIVLDTTFALAYLRRRDVAGWAQLTTSDAQRRTWLAKAQQFSGELPPRFRALVEFHLAYQAGDYARARSIVSGLIARDSSDVEAWYQLGEAHFHDAPTGVPDGGQHGNLGRALRAFQRTLALDSNYLVAYQHITDALGTCQLNQRVLCLPDSAVVAAPDELQRRFGEATVAAARDAAEEARIATARAWMLASPETERARGALIEMLIQNDRIGDARTEVNVLGSANPDSPEALFWRAQLTFLDSGYAEAGRLIGDVLEQPTGLGFVLSQQLQDYVLNILSVAGRVQTLYSVFDRIIALIPGDSVRGPNNQWITPPLLLLYVQAGQSAAFGTDSAAASRWNHAWLDSLRSHYEAHERPGFGPLWDLTGATVMLAYLASRDTTLLTRYLSAADTAGSRTWRSMWAHLALRRGDSVAVRAAAEYVSTADSVEFLGNAGLSRMLGWGEFLARRGNLPEALRVYQAADRANMNTNAAALIVRSWAERGALYQQLGETDRAIALYEKFIAAWAGGDAEVQPMVERARSAVAALKGEVREPARR